MKKAVLKGFGPALVLSLALFMLAGCRNTSEITIGAIISLTSQSGTQSDGEGVRDGMSLAIQELNDRGGINGRRLRLLLEDGKSDPAAAKAAFQKIESAEKPLLYVATLTPPSLELAPLAGQAQVVLFSLISAVEKVTQVNQWIYRYWPMNAAQVPVYLSTLARLNVKRLGILHLNDDYGTSLSEMTAVEFRKSGGSVKREAFDPAKMDLSRQVAGLLDAEAILVLGQTAQTPGALAQIREKKFAGPVLANNTVSDPAIIALPQTQGVFSALPIIFNPNFIAARELKKKFQDRYGKQTSHSSAAGYDLIKLVGEVLEDQEISRPNLKARLEKGFIHSGALGDVRLEPGKRDLSFPLFPARILNGQVQY